MGTKRDAIENFVGGKVHHREKNIQRSFQHEDFSHYHTATTGIKEEPGALV